MRRRIERAGKIEDVAHRRGAEGIDCLRIIADHGQTASTRSQRQHDLALQRVGVLIFIDQQMIEAPGDLGSDRRLGQHLGEIEQEIVVIEHVLALLHLHVRSEERAQRILVRRDPGKPFAERRLEIAARIDHARIDRQTRRLGRETLLRFAKASLVARPVHEVGRILAVVDGELRIEPEARGIFAQQPRAKAMERSRIGRRRGSGRLRRETAGKQAFDAAAKLGRRTTREGGEHDALRISARENERGHPMRQHRRLARAGAGDDEQRPGTLRIANPVLDREPLLGIELDGRARANQGERHGATQPCFPLCSQGRWTRAAVLVNVRTNYGTFEVHRHRPRREGQSLQASRASGGRRGDRHHPRQNSDRAADARP